MVEWTAFGTRWRIGVPFLAFLSVCLMCDKSYTAAFCVLASVLHEGGHVLALLLLGDPPCEVSAGICGIRLIPAPAPLSYSRQMVMLLAGPLLNLLCAAFLALCGATLPAVLPHLVLGIFNLLPIEALDGGGCLWCLLARWGDARCAEKVMRWVSVAVLLPLATLGFWLLICYKNFSLAAVCVYLIIRLFGNERI